jgi:hypothetical protein
MSVAAPFTAWSDQKLEKELLDSINLDTAWPVVEQFSEIVRLSGSPEERKAFQILIDHLESWGVPYTLHEPECYISWPLGATLRTLGPDGKSYRAKTTAMALATDGEIEAELVYVPPRIPEGTIDDWSFGLDFRGLDVTGKIVIADGMASPGRVIDVLKAGALAAIFVNPGEAIHESIVTTVWGTPDLDSRDRQEQLPILGVNHRDGEELIALAKQGGAKVAASTSVDTRWRKIPVLVADIPGALSDEFVLLHGHLDSWHQGVGDNATGDASMLEIARAFWAKRDQLARGVKVAWWSGHSHGRYAGSTWFADNFAIELAKGCVAQVNCDSPGCRWADTFNELTAMTETYAFIDTTIRETTGITPRPERPARAGDYSFNGIGISSFYMLSSTMSQEARDEKGYYPVGGCGANIQWHTEDDLMPVADRDNLLRDIKMYAASVLRVANAPVLPFDWRATTEEFRATLAKYQKAAGDEFDFGPAVQAVDALEGALNAFYAQMPDAASAGDADARSFNRVQRMLACILVPVNYSRTEAFRHDPALEIQGLPDLEPAMTMPHVKNDDHERGMLKAHLLRGRNRVVWALEQAKELVESGTR